MTAQIRIVNDGPDEAEVVVGGKHTKWLSPGEGMVLCTNKAVSFTNRKPATEREIAEHMGLTYQPPEPSRNTGGAYVEDA